jgi:hypothetical protein
MKKITLFFIFSLVLVLIPSSYSFEPEKGFYVEYRVYGYPEDPYPSSAFALLKEHQEWDIKYLYIKDMVYKYQVQDIKNNIAYIRICFEGTALGDGHNITGQRAVPFKRIFDIKVDLNTLEMVDENGAWGKWLFWIKLGSYNRREHTIMKNWNDHGEVKGWIYGPYENEVLYSILHSPYVNNTTNFFRIDTLKKVKIEKDYTVIYPSFKEYGIVTSYKDYKTPEGTIRSGGYGGYYLDEIVIGISMGGGKVCEKTYDPGLNTSIYYTEDGLFIETLGSYWIDDFVDQKLGIVVLQPGNNLFLTDYGVSDDILIEEPTPENQRTSFEKEIEQMLGRSPKDSEGTVTTETPSTPPETQTTEPPEQKSEIPAPTTTQPQEDTENNTTLYYVAPLLIVMIIAVFIVLREKR